MPCGVQGAGGGVGIGKVFSHGVSLHQIQAQPAVPRNQRRGNRRRATAGQHDFIEAKLRQYFARDDLAKQRDGQQKVELFCRHFAEHALLKF